MKQKILLGVGVVIAIAIGAVVWRSITPQAPSAGQEYIAADVSSAIAAASCQGADVTLCKFLAGWAVTTEYKVVGTQKTNGLTIPYEYSNEKDAYHLKTTVQDKPYELINRAKTLYIKNTEFGWWWVQPEIPTLYKYKDTQFEYDFPSTTIAYAKSGDDQCGTAMCTKYKLAQPDKPEYTLWIDTQNFVLRRLEITTPDSAIEQTFTYLKVNITTPEPLRQLPDSQFIPPKADTPINLP